MPNPEHVKAFKSANWDTLITALVQSDDSLEYHSSMSVLDLAGADLRGVRFSRMTKVQCDRYQELCSNSVLDLAGADLRGTVLQGYFSDEGPPQVRLGLNACGAQFDGACLSSMRIDIQYLYGGSFVGSIFDFLLIEGSESKIHGSNFTGANFIECRISGIDEFCGCNFTGAHGDFMMHGEVKFDSDCTGVSILKPWRTDDDPWFSAIKTP